MPPTSSLGLLSATTGLAAYIGVFKASTAPRRGEICVVSAAGGAVGSIAAQLCKTTGARVIGIVGRLSLAVGGGGDTPVESFPHEKCARVREPLPTPLQAGGETKRRFMVDKLGIEAIDYKSSEKTVTEQLDALAPDGVDFFFDNVGGEILDVSRLRRPRVDVRL